MPGPPAPREASASTRRHQLRATEKELATLTRQRERLTPQLEAAGAGNDHEALGRIGTELAGVSAKIDALEERWLSLAEESSP